MTHGNGIVTTYSYDQDGRVTQISASDGTTVSDAVYQYDAASQIDAIDFADNNLDRDYNYGALSRITYDDGPTASDTLSYDLVGNRTSLNAVNFVYETNSNRLIERNGKPFVHDASGNMLETNNGKRVYTYNHAGRIETYTYQGELRGTYRYDGHGRRRVVDTSIPIRYFYGDGSQYISQVEMDSDTLTIIDKTYDVIWMGDTPVAHYTIEYYPGGSVKKKNTEFLHTDHLATPRLATDDTGTAVWRWEGDAFGQDGPDQDVDGDGENIVINLRFPGQIKTHWAETYYNYFRDYDPSTGRYVTSDPIGLQGGLNTYLYVNANPLRFTDPRGLDNVGCTTEPLTIDGRCKRICCAIHDKCYDDNSCTADSWTSDSGCNAEACDNCNKEVVKCFVWCDQAEPMGIEPAPGTPEYYCPAQHRYIKIPGDFPTVEAAKAVCGS